MRKQAIIPGRKETVMSKVETARREQVFFEDVEVGSEIPALTRGPYTAVRIGIFIGAMWTDFAPSHFDGISAQKMGRPGILVHSNHIFALLGQLFTDWMGPNGALKRFAAKIRADVYDGDTLTVGAKVTKKYAQDGGYHVEFEIWGNKQDGTLIATGSATVDLPSRS